MMQRPFPRPLKSILPSQEPSAGDLNELKISRTYFQALSSGVIPVISKGLAIRLSRSLGISQQQFNALVAYGDSYKAFHDPDQNLLFSMEQGSRFSRSLNAAIRSSDYLDKTNMVELLRNNRSAFEVSGAMPLLLRNVASYFAKTPEEHGLNEHEDEHVIKTIDGYMLEKNDFITESKEKDAYDREITVFSVNEEFVPGLFSSVYTDSDSWKRYHDRPSVADRFNTLHFTLSYDVSKRLKQSIASDLEKDSLFSTVEQGKTDWLLQDMYSSSNARDGEVSFYSGKRPIFTLPDQSRELAIRLYPFQASPQSVSPLLDTFTPTIEQQLLLKRMYFRMTHPDD